MDLAAKQLRRSANLTAVVSLQPTCRRCPDDNLDCEGNPSPPGFRFRQFRLVSAPRESGFCLRNFRCHCGMRKFLPMGDVRILVPKHRR